MRRTIGLYTAAFFGLQGSVDLVNTGVRYAIDASVQKASLAAIANVCQNITQASCDNLKLATSGSTGLFLDYVNFASAGLYMLVSGFLVYVNYKERTQEGEATPLNINNP